MIDRDSGVWVVCMYLEAEREIIRIGKLDAFGNRES